MNRQEFEEDDKLNWAMWEMFSLLMAMLRYKAFPGKRTEADAISILKAAAPYFGEREVRRVEKVVSRGR